MHPSILSVSRQYSVLRELSCVPACVLALLLTCVLACVPVLSFADTPPITVEPETLPSDFSTDTFIPDFLGPGFVTISTGRTFDFEFDVPEGEQGLYQIQVRHASNNSISILVDGAAITPDLALSTRTLGFWFDNEAYVTLSAGPHVLSFSGPVFLDTFRITRTPPDPDRFLTYPTSINEVFFAGNEENSIAYYNTIDPNSERATLAGFRELNGFTAGGVEIYDESNPAAVAVQESLNGTDFSHAVYQNIADLDLGRNMYVLKFDNGDVASYVQNFATPDNALDRRNLLATVAMEYRAEERLTTFYAYGSNGNRVTKVDLDGRGQKYVPTLCAACHGGKPKDDINGVYQNGGNIGSKWIAWDLENFEFSDRLSLTDQESEFRSMNQAVLCTTPSVSNAELVRGWYGGDESSNCSAPLPDAPFNGDYVPDGWNATPEHRELYLEVVRPSCRACHAQRGTYADNTLLERKRELEFSTFEHFALYKDQIEKHVFDQAVMPSALVTYEAFWRSRGTDIDQPEILDRVLYGGLAHVNPPASVFSSDAKNIFGARRQPGRPNAKAAATKIVTTGVEGRLNALPSEYATNISWSVTGGDPLNELPSNEPVLTITPTGEHEVTLDVSNFEGTYTDSTTITVNTDDDQLPSSVLFDPDIKDLLQSSSGGLSCTSCHQPGGRANTVFHFSESSDFLGNLTPEQFAYNQALTRVDCRDPDSSLLLRRPANPNHFGGAVLQEGSPGYNMLRRWIAEGAPFDENRSFSEPGSDCGVVINDPDHQPADIDTDTGIRAEHPRLITLEGTNTVWVEFSDNTKQVVDTACRQQLLENHNFDERVLSASVLQSIPNRSSSLSCDAIAALPKQDINSVPTPVQPGLDLEIREFAVIPDNTQFGRLRIKPGLLAMAHTGGRLFVVEQHEGKVWEITNGVVADRPWFDAHQAFINATGDGISVQNLFHGGLRSIAFHPEFSSNGKFYTSQMRNRPDNQEGVRYISDTASISVFTDSTLSEWTVDDAGNVVGHRELFRIGYSAEDHLMKQIMFNPSAQPGSPDYGLLYIGHGDGTLGDFFGSGQNDDALGKILRIDPLADGDEPYTIPTSNPFVNDDSWETDEVFATGFRNPHHIAFAKDGTVIVADIGRSNIEEVNVIGAGSNHGWPDREGTFTHLKEQGGAFLTGIRPLPADDADLGYTYPAAQYGHIGSYGNPFTGHSIAGGFVVENGSAWDGQYLYGDFVNFGDIYHTSLQELKDAVTRGTPDSLTQATTRRARVLFDHDNNPATEPQIFPTMLEVINNSPRYFSHSGTRRADLRFGQGPDGEIYIVNKRNNTIYLVTNSQAEGTQPVSIGPTTPGNLRHLVYTETTAELFWDAASDDGFVQGYEIIRNGQSLGVRDVLSLFEDSLEPAETYKYELTAIDTDGNRSETVTITFTTGGSAPIENANPTTPGNLRHVVHSSTSAEISWDRSTDDGLVQGYEITRNGDSLGVQDVLSIFENGLDAAETYTYSVTAIDTEGNRSDTVFTTLTTLGGNPPDTSAGSNRPSAPENVKHVVHSANAVEISWDRASDDGFVQGYEILRNGDSLGVLDVLSIFEEELDPAATYIYTITSIDNEGNRSDPTTITLSTGSGDKPAPPGNLQFLLYSSTSAEIIWERAVDDGFVQGYEITRNGESLGIRDALSLFEPGLDPALLYTYKVISIDDDGNRSEPAEIVFSTGNKPTTPGNLRREIHSMNAAEIFWDRSADNQGIQGYEVIRNGQLLGVLDSLSLFENALDPTVAYTYTVTAIDKDGFRSDPVSITFSTDGNPTKPGNLRHRQYSESTGELIWDRAVDNRLVQGYEVTRNGASLGVVDALSLFLQDLDPTVAYTYSVTSIDNEGNRSESAVITVSNGNRPTVPANLRHQVYSSTAAELFWDRVSDNGSIQGYEVKRNGETLGIVDGQSLFQDELSPDITYSYEISTIDNDGNRSIAAKVSVSTGGG
ncbi:MAG: PQQ-dependent sugar dehydrogenase [Granulosicoccus sp.]|nr:PQQ-dependent sugar dehydrogenase [Granulosicoccus sp.]